VFIPHFDNLRTTQRLGGWLRFFLRNHVVAQFDDPLATPVNILATDPVISVAVVPDMSQRFNRCCHHNHRAAMAMTTTTKPTADSRSTAR
jgi:hypothetical protein